MGKMVKHPHVVAFEKQTGCQAVTELGNEFAKVDSDTEPSQLKLMSSNKQEQLAGKHPTIYRGKPLK